MVEAEDGKSTLHFPDNKSMFSQFDVMSQYSNYIETKQQAEDEALIQFANFKDKQHERKKQQRKIRFDDTSYN